MDESPAYHLDVDGLKERTPEAGAPRDDAERRPWVGIRFNCCGVYTRVYRNQDATAYRGQCPKCLREVSLRVGAEGTDSRFFVAE